MSARTTYRIERDGQTVELNSPHVAEHRSRDGDRVTAVAEGSA